MLCIVNETIVAILETIWFVFALDKNIPEFTVDEPAYQKVLKDDLALVVIKDGSINSYVTIPRELEEGKRYESGKNSNVVGNITMEYIGINANDETLLLGDKYDLELGCIDYAGVTSTGKRTMGLAQIDVNPYKLIPDCILSWNIPQILSMEDAATMPYASVLAHYALIIKAKINPGETVLVHNGCTPVGLAAILLASNQGTSVFTTVTSDRQRDYLKKHFHFMNDGCIFSACNTSFEAHILMATTGKGVNIILNCVSHSMLNASLRCIANSGRFIQLGKFDLEGNMEIGMRVFLKNVNFYNVTIEDIFCAADDVKQLLHSLVTKELGRFAVKPLLKEIVDQKNVKSLLRKAKHPDRIGKIIVKLSNNVELGQLNKRNMHQFICNPDHSYLVYGGSVNMWMDIVAWLVFRGARKIVVSSKSQPQQAHVGRRLKLYKIYHNSQIMFLSADINKRNSFSKLLTKVYKLGPIGAVFTLPSRDSESKDAEIKIVQYISSDLQTIAPNALLINFISSATGICDLRNSASCSGYNIRWQNSTEFSNVLYALEDMLTSNMKEIVVKDKQLNTLESVESLYKKLNLLLPTSTDGLKKEAIHATKEPDFVQLPSLSAPIMREVPPVFIIPGIFNTEMVQSLATNLLYPVYCASFPVTWLPFKNIAANLAQKIKEICPSGPYNLLGVSYGGSLATEIARILEEDKARVLIQYLDGAPDTVQGIFKRLGGGNNNQIGLLCCALNITNNKVIKEINNLIGWEARMNIALKHSKCSPEEEMLLREILTTLIKYLDEASNLQPYETLMSCQTCLFRPTGSDKNDYCGLLNYFQKEPLIYIVDGDHRSMLGDKVTATIINNNAIAGSYPD